VAKTKFASGGFRDAIETTALSGDLQGKYVLKKYSLINFLKLKNCLDLWKSTLIKLYKCIVWQEILLSLWKMNVL
jgi:hypothetical protein